jgi:hypothetical protein
LLTSLILLLAADRFVAAYPAETTEAFLDAHVRAFDSLDGAPRFIRLPKFKFPNPGATARPIRSQKTKHLKNRGVVQNWAVYAVVLQI